MGHGAWSMEHGVGSSELGAGSLEIVFGGLPKLSQQPVPLALRMSNVTGLHDGPSTEPAVS
jgi:hypothetical protein